MYCYMHYLWIISGTLRSVHLRNPLIFIHLFVPIMWLFRVCLSHSLSDTGVNK
jgi:hypothetical protein